MKCLLPILLIIFSSPVAFAQNASELFSEELMEYKGSNSEQALLLLRHVGLWGEIKKKASIDTAFLDLLEKPIHFNKSDLRNYLATIKVSENETGGSLDKDISTICKNETLIKAKYFVIHDVSTPAYENNFPANINDSTWIYNRAKTWSREITHTYLTRTGELKTVTDFSEGLRATKFEIKILGVQSKGLFIHVELVQPRVYPPGTAVTAPIAPEPGFTEIQYKRLALLYVCASLRKGDWLIPAFHAVIDEGIIDGHDDPQNFNLSKFTTEVLKLNSLLEL